jgi:predicted ribosomally synthesized peptide with nif11-like leader
MSQSEVERFATDLKSDAQLRAEVEKGGRLDRAVDIAARRGYSFTFEELRSGVLARAKAAGRELSPAELDTLSGGSWSLGCDIPGLANTRAPRTGG